MDIQSRPLLSRGILSRAAGMSPEKVAVDVQRQQSFTFGMNRNQHLSSKFTKLWHERMLARTTLVHKEFKVKLMNYHISVE